MPISRPMPSIGPRCHELRIKDESHAWRIIYRADVDGILIVDIFDKKQDKTPKRVIHSCKRELDTYDKAKKGSA
jgi:phage-related protein